MEVLVLDVGVGNAWALLGLLTRAGFEVDVIAISPQLRLSRYIRRFHLAGSPRRVAEDAIRQAAGRNRPYDLVIATADTILSHLRDMEATGQAPSHLLPLLPDGDRTHLGSKIGLSRMLSKAGLRTPQFRVARNRADVLEAARALGYPIMVKVDLSWGGTGVYPCANDLDVIRLPEIFTAPVLVQKKIDGQVVDLSALFLGGELIHFCYSVYKQTHQALGGSIVRTYRPLSLVDQTVFAELTELGRTFGAHGFTNITCIDAADGSGRHYIECDMRPNVWSAISPFSGDDPAVKARNWFADRTSMTWQSAPATDATDVEITVPYFLRMRALDILRNRHDVWRFVPRGDPELLRSLLIQKFAFALLTPVKRLIPRQLRPRIRAGLLARGVLAR